jgi:LysR family transcriptional activator of nhaA
MKIQIGRTSVWINYHHLYCFLVVAQEGSLSDASKKLGIGQSALSIQIKQLENSLGFPVFERSHRRLTLNETGLVVLSYAKEIFRIGGEMVQAVHDRPRENRVHLQIGTLDSIPKHLTLELVHRALDSKKCTVSVLEGNQQDLLRNLSEHQLDLVLTNSSNITIQPNLHSRRIARLPLWVVGTKDFLKLKNKFPNSMAGAPCIVPTSDSVVRHEIESFFKSSKVRPDYIAETQDVMIQKLLALSGIGITIAPEFAVREYVASKRLFLIGKLDNAFEELFIVSATRKIENPIAAKLMKGFTIR